MSDCVGIDLGTTFSCVSIFRHGRLEVFPNDRNSRTTPSYVAFVDNNFIVGEEAKSQSLIEPSSVAYDAKRLLGRKYSDSILQKDLKHWAFKVINECGKPTVIVKNESEERALLPAQVSAMVLKELIDIAEEKLGTRPTRAVITVPAYFNDTQRQATKDAARIARLNVIKLINEPTAAAIAFAVNKNENSEKKVLVYDLGGGTFDVSILKIKNGNIEVIAVNGDTHLGGRDFDNKIVEHFVDEIQTKFGVNLYNEEYKKSLARLRQSCEELKKLLSAPRRVQATLEVDTLFDGRDFLSSLTRAQFNEICDELMQNTLTHVTKALKDANMNKQDIDEILMVGGSTKIPKIREIVEEYFGKKGNVTVNADEAVACGAAIQAALLEGEPDEAIAGLTLTDVTPLSYGIKVLNEEMSVIINRNSAYPYKTFKSYVTVHNNQDAVDIEIFQGEQKQTHNNHYLGKFTVTQLPRAKAGAVKILVTFEIDEDGILVVRAFEPSSGISKNVTVTNALDRLSEEQVNQLVLEAEAMRI